MIERHDLGRQYTSQMFACRELRAMVVFSCLSQDGNTRATRSKSRSDRQEAFPMTEPLFWGASVLWLASWLTVIWAIG